MKRIKFRDEMEDAVIEAFWPQPTLGITELVEREVWSRVYHVWSPVFNEIERQVLLMP